MIRTLALLLPCALLAACSGGAGAGAGDEEGVVVVAPVVQPAGFDAPGPAPTSTPTPSLPCLVVGPTNPGAGDADSTFGCGGVTSYAKSGVDVEIRAVAVQPDDKIVVAGVMYTPAMNHHEAWVARFTTTGTLDTTFATSGVFTRSFVPFGGPTSAEAVVIQPSGAIVVGGGFFSEDQAGAVRTAYVLRLLANGTLDTTFGTAGVLQTTSMSYVRALRLQASGSIAAVGEKCVGASFQCVAAVGRLAGSTGTPDAAFGTGGFVTTNFGGAAPSIARAAAVSGTSVLMAGRTTSGTETNAALARYGATGIDTTFGTNGFATYDSADIEQVTGIANIGTGFVFVESMSQSGTNSFMFTRVQSNGTPTATFGFFGRFFVNFAGYGAQANGVVVTPESQIIGVGSAKTSTDHDRIAITRVNGSGTLDTTFSSDGYTMMSGGGEDAIGNAVALQNTGRIVVGGWARPSGSGAMKRGVLVRVRNQ